MALPARPIAPLPHNQPPQHPPSSSSSQPPAPRPQYKAPFYIPTPEQIAPGARNHLFLSLRSGLPDEVDWALPRLVVTSYDFTERFNLADFPYAVSALLEWPTRWVEDLERCAALRTARGKGTAGLALAAMPEWIIDPAVEQRAINSLLVLRNASFAGSNARHLAKKAITAFLVRFFDLPQEYMLDLLLHSPEPVHHLLVLLDSIFPHLPADQPDLHRLYSQMLPAILIETRDMALLQLILPLLISALTLPSLPVMLPTLIPHLLLLLTLSPAPPTLDLILDLLISLTLSPGPARVILASPELSNHLKHLVRLLSHGARVSSANFDPPQWTLGVMVKNPASTLWSAEDASRKRAIARQEAQGLIANPQTAAMVQGDTGDRPPVLPDVIKRRLFTMKEPQRSIQWQVGMHESFVYSSTTQLMQVQFWHAYREFFSQPGVVDQVLSASDVIKNVTTAFPGAAAKVWMDETGTNRFVIAGLGFRRSTEELERFVCRWRDCPNPLNSSNALQLITHLHATHLVPQPATTCCWSTCQQSHCSLSHVLTHIPLSQGPAPSDWIMSNSKNESLYTSQITRRAPPRLPAAYKLHFAGSHTPTDSRRNPAGVSFLTALLIRNLAKTLRSEIATALPEDYGMTDTAKAARKQHLREERFGLPIPDAVLKEEEEEERLAKGAAEMDVEGRLNWDERDRARAAFEGLEEKLGEIAANNMSNLGQYLGEAWGWS